MYKGGAYGMFYYSLVFGIRGGEDIIYPVLFYGSPWFYWSMSFYSEDFTDFFF